MMRMRRGPGLVGTMARTAVVVGTATAVSGGVAKHQQGKADAQAQAQQAQVDAQQQETAEQAQIQDMQAQMQQMQAQQAQAAVAGASGAPPTTDMAGQLQQLASMKQSGILSEEEFQAAKAKVLGGS